MLIFQAQQLTLSFSPLKRFKKLALQQEVFRSGVHQVFSRSLITVVISHLCLYNQSLNILQYERQFYLENASLHLLL